METELEPRTERPSERKRWLIFGVVGSLLLLASAIPVLTFVIASLRCASCGKNLLVLSVAMQQYASLDPNGRYPMLSDQGGRLMWDEGKPVRLIDGYLEAATLVCPSDPVSRVDIGDSSYWYVGYVLTNDDEVEAFVDVYRKTIAAGGNFDGDLPAPPGKGSMGGDVFLRLNANLDSGRTPIPVFIEPPGHHFRESGGAVVNHRRQVKWLQYPGEFPMTERTIAALRSIEAK